MAEPVHWAIAMTLIQTAKLNGVDPMAWLTDVLERIVSGRTKAQRAAHAAAVELEGRQRRNTLHPGSLIDQSAQPYAVKESQPPVAAATLIPTALVSDSATPISLVIDR